MDLVVINLIGIVGIGILVYMIYGKVSNSSNSNTDESVRQLMDALKNGEINSLTKILSEISKGSQQQIQNTADQMQKLEQRFSLLQQELINNQNNNLTKTSEKLDLQLNRQQTEFSKIKEENSQQLQKLQTQVSVSLSNSINQLTDLNRKNFDLLSKTNQDKLSQIQEGIEKRMDENLRKNLESFEDVTKNLGQMQSTAQKMIDSTKSVDKLNNIFERTSSKAFGNFGEQYLEKLLKEHLSKSVWQSQVSVPGSQDKIDFLINLGNKKIGIDSKFPVTKYQDFINSPLETRSQALKEYLKSVLFMAKEIATKYGKNNFTDALLIYLPSDSMYNEVVNDQTTMEKLQELKISPSSPATIFPLIMMIQTYEFRLNVNENAENIISGLTVVKKNIDSFRNEFRKLGDKIRQAQQNFDTADKNLVTVQNTVHKLEHTTELNSDNQENKIEDNSGDLLL